MTVHRLGLHTTGAQGGRVPGLEVRISLSSKAETTMVQKTMQEWVRRGRRGLRTECWEGLNLRAQDKTQEPKNEKEMVLSERVVVVGTWEKVRSQIWRAWIKLLSSLWAQILVTEKRLYFLGLIFLNFKVKR